MTPRRHAQSSSAREVSSVPWSTVKVQAGPTPKLGLTGRVVVVNGEIAAYTFGYSMGVRMFCVMLEIADVNIKGLPVYVFRELCKDPRLESCDFINVMDDSGLENIAAVKASFYPVLMNPSYTVRKR